MLTMLLPLLAVISVAIGSAQTGKGGGTELERAPDGHQTQLGASGQIPTFQKTSHNAFVSPPEPRGALRCSPSTSTSTSYSRNTLLLNPLSLSPSYWHPSPYQGPGISEHMCTAKVQSPRLSFSTHLYCLQGKLLGMLIKMPCKMLHKQFLRVRVQVETQHWRQISKKDAQICRPGNWSRTAK